MSATTATRAARLALRRGPGLWLCSQPIAQGSMKWGSLHSSDIHVTGRFSKESDDATGVMKRPPAPGQLSVPQYSIRNTVGRPGAASTSTQHPHLGRGGSPATSLVRLCKLALSRVRPSPPPSDHSPPVTDLSGEDLLIRPTSPVPPLSLGSLPAKIRSNGLPFGLATAALRLLAT